MYRFIAEAKRIWELEASQPRMTTIQAGILLSIFYSLCGLDEIGQKYRIQAIALAQSMRLFNSDTEGPSHRIRHWHGFHCMGFVQLGNVSWFIWRWPAAKLLRLIGYSFMAAPLLSDPPDWHLPDPSATAEWYGEIWLKYPLSDCLVPSYFGQIFKARSQFRVIMNEACQATYLKDEEMTLNKAAGFLSQLQGWYDRLPGTLQPRYIVLPGHFQLQ